MLRDYLPILIQIVVAILFAAAALGFSVILGKRGRRGAVKDSPYECGMLPLSTQQPRFAVKFYMVAMLFLLFDLEIVFMYPWAVAFKPLLENGLTVFWSMLAFIGIVTLGYVYAIKKGVLEWKR